MSLYWMYMGDQSGSIVQPSMNPSLIGQEPKFADPNANHLFLNNKVLSPLTLPAQPTLQDLKLSWAFLPSFLDKPDTSKHFHIFVGDLCPNLDLPALQEAFSQFGQVSDCKIIQDPQTLKSKGYGFVSFVKKDDAEKAIKEMNGQYIGSRAIRTNWAIRKGSSHLDGGKSFNYEDILSQPASSNCTVYCGGIMTNLTEEAIKKTFEVFGDIVEIRIFQEKGYAFIKFSNKEDAARAIIDVHLTEVAGHVVKCAWGKKAEDQLPLQAFFPFAQILPAQLLRPAIPPPIPLTPTAAAPLAPVTTVTPLPAPSPAAYTLLNQHPQSQCFTGFPFTLPPAPLAASSTGGTTGAAVPAVPYDSYYLYPTAGTPAATAAPVTADLTYQKSLEVNLTHQLLEQQQQQPSHHAAMFSSLSMPAAVFPGVTGLPPQPQTLNFPNPGIVYSVP